MASGYGVAAGLGQGLNAFVQNYYRSKGIKRKEGMEDSAARASAEALSRTNRHEDEDRLSKVSYMKSKLGMTGPAATADAIPGTASPAVLSSQTPGAPQQVNPLQRAEREAASYDQSYADLMGQAGTRDRENASLKPRLNQGLSEFKKYEKLRADLPVAFRKLEMSRANKESKLMSDRNYIDASPEDQKKMMKTEMGGVEAQMRELTRKKKLYKDEHNNVMVEMVKMAMEADPRIKMLLEQLFQQSSMQRPGTESQINEILKPIGAEALIR